MVVARISFSSIELVLNLQGNDNFTSFLHLLSGLQFTLFMT
jgi:hypothetical protein